MGFLFTGETIYLSLIGHGLHWCSGDLMHRYGFSVYRRLDLSALLAMVYTGVQEI